MTDQNHSACAWCRATMPATEYDDHATACKRQRDERGADEARRLQQRVADELASEHLSRDLAERSRLRW